MRATGGTKSLASWRRLNDTSEHAKLWISKPSAALIVLACACGACTATRHYDLQRTEGWVFDNPPTGAPDFHRARAKCPKCAGGASNAEAPTRPRRP